MPNTRERPESRKRRRPSGRKRPDHSHKTGRNACASTLSHRTCSCTEACPCQAQKGSREPIPYAMAPDPTSHTRELAPRDVLAPVSDDPVDAIPLFIAKIPVRSVSHAACAAARSLAAFHSFAHELRRFAVLRANRQPPVRPQDPAVERHSWQSQAPSPPSLRYISPGLLSV